MAGGPSVPDGVSNNSSAGLGVGTGNPSSGEHLLGTDMSDSDYDSDEMPDLISDASPENIEENNYENTSYVLSPEQQPGNFFSDLQSNDAASHQHWHHTSTMSLSHGLAALLFASADGVPQRRKRKRSFMGGNCAPLDHYPLASPPLSI